MGKKMINEQVTIRNGQRGFVGPDGKWYPGARDQTCKNTHGQACSSLQRPSLEYL